MIISLDAILAVFLSFAVTAVICPLLIPFLIRLKVGQTERVEGVQSHLKKAGTPTMGGIAILVSVILTSLLFARRYPRVLPVLFLTAGFGVIGFIDDYLKVVLRRSDGLYPRQKMTGQIIVTTAFIAYLWLRAPECLDYLIPFTKGFVLSGLPVRIAATVIAYFAVIGTVNGVNFTDGLDGLASSVTAVVAVFYTICACFFKAGIEPFTAAVLGAYMMKMPVFILIIGLVYLVEVLSVMIQVTYFRKTGGKRFFKMAPIHHHFELSGWSETRIVAVFTIVTILLCMLAAIRLS